MKSKKFCRFFALMLSFLLLWSEGSSFVKASALTDLLYISSSKDKTAQNPVNQYMDMSELEGFAAEPGEGLLGTTGGNTGEIVIVENTADFVNAIRDDFPRIVVVKGQIVSMLSNDAMDVGSATNLENKMAVKSKGGFGLSVGSNKTIVGYDENAELYGGLKINNESNVIVSNLNIHGVWPYTGPSDTMEVSNSHHVWLNHLNIWNSKDGNLDIKTGADYITVSWSKFWYEDVVCEWDLKDGTQGNREYKAGDTALAKDHGHRLSCLIGSGAGDHDDTDMDKLHVTYHHNWFADFVKERMPRVMYGRAHVYNNYYTCSDNLYCIGVDSYAAVLIENNYFKKVKNPHQFAYPENKKLGASIVERGNSYESVSGTKASGQKNDKEISLFKNAAYDYHLHEAAKVPGLVSKYAGNQGLRLSDSEKGSSVEGVDDKEVIDTSKVLPTIAPANLSSNDKKMISYEDSSKTYTYKGQNADGSNGFYTISNPFAGKDFTEDVAFQDGYPAWSKGVTIAYWVKLPAGSSVSDAAVLNFNLENDRQLYNRDGVHYKRCAGYSPSSSAYSLGEKKKYVGEDGRIFTVLENYGNLVRYNPSYPVAGYYYTTNEGGAYRVYEQGTDPSVDSNWTYLGYIGKGYYADYAYLYDEDPVYGAYSKHREALVSGSFSLYASGSMGYRQDSSDDNTLQRNPNLPTYGNYMSMHKLNQFYYWANGSTYTNKKSSYKSPSMADTASNWHYVVTVITNDWVQSYIDGTELTTDYLNYWGSTFRLQNSAEGFNLGYGHRGFYRTKTPSMDFEGDTTILDFISDKDTSLCIGGLGAGATYVGQNTIKTPAGTQVKGLEFYDVPLKADQISGTGVTLPAGYEEAPLKTENSSQKYPVIPDKELDPPYE